MPSTAPKKYKENLKKTAILEAIAEGKTYNQIAIEQSTTVQYVTETLQQELMSATTPEKILELRQHQTDTLNAQTPKLHKRIHTQHSLAERLANKYEQILDETDQGQHTYHHYYDQNILDGLEPEQAHTQANLQLSSHMQQRQQTLNELEKITKLGNDNYQILLKHHERLAKLNALDAPTQHNLLIHRTDNIKIDLEQDILRTQQELQQPTLEAETIDE